MPPHSIGGAGLWQKGKKTHFTALSKIRFTVLLYSTLILK
jgi:hypothetical protein